MSDELLDNILNEFQKSENFNPLDKSLSKTIEEEQIMNDLINNNNNLFNNNNLINNII